MKLSIILGVIHMMFGVCLSFFNHRHFKKPLNIVCEFIPQVLFLGCIFGYLVILIFYKWISFSVTSKHLPSLLLATINMFLAFGKDIKDEDLLYSGQSAIQPLLVVTAVLCVPWMLLLKPLYLRHQHKKKQEPEGFHRLRGETSSDSELPRGIQDEAQGEVIHNEEFQKQQASEHEEEFDFGEVFVHQAIHTIEYCLGCISNTASYLRLWALSLAHAELSEVLWTMILHLALPMKGALGIVGTFALFTVWAELTIAILLVMEGLSAFLHALRLHWVEFQSKFYTGAGYLFMPFSFEHILSGEDGD
ncbi:V-type proton ATPase 116 kDa subunit a isoform 1 [Exaiptasia diaphana]|nr:V-type proton ATPase 116 kDa subunit a isoform 1 [Exaiptasia diaphana]